MSQTNMNSSPVRSLAELTTASARKSIWWWIACIFLTLCAAVFLWWGGTFVYHLITFRPTGKIVYECWPERATSRLCVINADGSGYKQLTLRTTDRAPLWSPDGKRIVFMRFGSGLFLINSDGSGLRQITDEFAGSPSWSPDDKHLAFTKFESSGKVEGVFIIQIDNLNLTQVSSFGFGPAWSPDSKNIAFTDRKNGVYVLDTETANQIQIVKGISVKSLLWSPNSLQIALSKYTDSTETSTSLGLVNSDGTNLKQFNVHASSPAWSPDGTKIAYHSGDELWLMNADGSGKTQLTHAFLGFNYQPDSPSWSPDGQYIVYWQHNPFCFLCNMTGELWIMRADGSQQTKLTNGPVDQNPAWQPAP